MIFSQTSGNFAQKEIFHLLFSDINDSIFKTDINLTQTWFTIPILFFVLHTLHNVLSRSKDNFHLRVLHHTIRSIVIVTPTTRPSFFHLHQYPINDEETDENSNENEIKWFFNETRHIETKSTIKRSPQFRKKRFVNILTDNEVKRFRMFVTANQ